MNTTSEAQPVVKLQSGHSLHLVGQSSVRWVSALVRMHHHPAEVQQVPHHHLLLEELRWLDYPVAGHLVAGL